jgi:hypothetical protein
MDVLKHKDMVHCHMLVWLEGGLNPNQITEKALANGGDLKFQEKLLAFLDDTISTSIPGDPDPNFELELVHRGKTQSCIVKFSKSRMMPCFFYAMSVSAEETAHLHGSEQS